MPRVAQFYLKVHRVVWCSVLFKGSSHVLCGVLLSVAQFYLKVHPMFLCGSCCSVLFKGSSHVFVWFVLLSSI